MQTASVMYCVALNFLFLMYFHSDGSLGADGQEDLDRM